MIRIFLRGGPTCRILPFQIPLPINGAENHRPPLAMEKALGSGCPTTQMQIFYVESSFEQIANQNWIQQQGPTQLNSLYTLPWPTRVCRPPFLPVPNHKVYLDHIPSFHQQPYQTLVPIPMVLTNGPWHSTVARCHHQLVYLENEEWVHSHFSAYIFEIHQVLNHYYFWTKLIPNGFCPRNKSKPSSRYFAPIPTNVVKLNFDGSFNPMTSQEGIGGIIRNGAGAMVTAFAGMIKDTRSIEVELQALITGVDFCYKLGHKIILIKGDCLIPVRSINECKNLPYSFMNN